MNRRGKHWYKWQETRKIFVKNNPDRICVACGQPASDVDHIKKRSTHPHLRYEQTNLQWMCRMCHTKKDGGMIVKL